MSAKNGTAKIKKKSNYNFYQMMQKTGTEHHFILLCQWNFSAELFWIWMLFTFF